MVATHAYLWRTSLRDNPYVLICSKQTGKTASVMFLQNRSRGAGAFVVRYFWANPSQDQRESQFATLPEAWRFAREVTRADR